MVAAWLTAFGIAALLAIRDRDLARLEIAAIGYVVFGTLQVVALIRFGDQVRWGTTAATAYLIVLATIPLVGGAGWHLSRKAHCDPAPDLADGSAVGDRAVVERTGSSG